MRPCRGISCCCFRGINAAFYQETVLCPWFSYAVPRLTQRIQRPDNASITDAKGRHKVSEISWNIAEARQRFSEIIRQSAETPQLIYNRNRLVAAVIAAEDYRAFQAWSEQRRAAGP
jgi:prevent-host-death family protein